MAFDWQEVGNDDEEPIDRGTIAVGLAYVLPVLLGVVVAVVTRYWDLLGFVGLWLVLGGILLMVLRVRRMRAGRT